VPVTTVIAHHKLNTGQSAIHSTTTGSQKQSDASPAVSHRTKTAHSTAKPAGTSPTSSETKAKTPPAAQGTKFPRHLRQPPPSARLEELVLQGHIRLGLQADTRAEDVGKGRALLGERIDDGGAGGRQRGLEHVAQHAEHAVEALVLGDLTALGVQLPLHAGHELGDHDQVDDQGRGEEGVLADVGDPDKKRLGGGIWEG